MAIALRKIGLPAEVQSESELQADSPAYAWLTALCTIMVEPQNHYEIVGVLREVYGVSDHDLAIFSEGIGARFQIETPVAAAGIVSSQLAELTELRAAIQALPLFAAVEQLVARTALRARLASLPREDFKNPLADLDTLLTFAAEAGATAATLADFAERLRSEMERQRPVRLSDQDAIQLITAQKAKGSEWDAVIVPFLSRRITGFSPRYPSLIRKSRAATKSSPPCTRRIAKRKLKRLHTRLRRQEMERLLYVALTRARHTLVLALDRALFSPVHDRLAVDSQLKYLRGDKGESSCAAIHALTEKAEACAKTSTAAEREARTPTAPPFAFPPLDSTLLARARDRASDFIHKQNPSGYDEPSDLEEVATTRPARTPGDTTATLYGSWWHTLFQLFPWKGSAEQWQAAFSAMQPESPERTRSAREWRLLIEGMLRDSLLTHFLKSSDVVHTEYPFLWRMDDRELPGRRDRSAPDRSAPAAWSDSRLENKSHRS